jgi:hypothetical protein
MSEIQFHLLNCGKLDSSKTTGGPISCAINVGKNTFPTTNVHLHPVDPLLVSCLPLFQNLVMEEEFCLMRY